MAGYPDVTVPAGFAGSRNAFFGAQWHDADLLDLAVAHEAAAGRRAT